MNKGTRYTFAATLCLPAFAFTYDQVSAPGPQNGWSLLMGFFAYGAVFLTVLAARSGGDR